VSFLSLSLICPWWIQVISFTVLAYESCSVELSLAFIGLPFPKVPGVVCRLTVDGSIFLRIGGDFFPLAFSLIALSDYLCGVLRGCCREVRDLFPGLDVVLFFHWLRAVGLFLCLSVSATIRGCLLPTITLCWSVVGLEMAG
ncbi:hypothetical protein A2U01_0013062, partial [Trifolium medium]|nr:hypothetical protein [Trifolium medium]